MWGGFVPGLCWVEVMHVERLRLELCDCMVDHMKKSAVTRKMIVFKKTSYSMCSIASTVYIGVEWFEFVFLHV